MGPFRQSDDATIRWVVKAGTGSIQDVTGWSFTFHVRQAGQVGYAITKVSSDTTQIAVTDAPNGKLEVYLLASDTASITPSATSYCYELIGVDQYGHSYTLDPALPNTSSSAQFVLIARL